MKIKLVLTIFLLLTFMKSVFAEEFIIDVRTPEEFNTGHIENSLNIVHTSILDGVTNYKISPSDTIFLYCRSGKRASIAQKILNENGYKNVINLGGYEDALRAVANK